jgi:hypothetical protein
LSFVCNEPVKCVGAEALGGEATERPWARTALRDNPFGTHRLGRERGDRVDHVIIQEATLLEVRSDEQIPCVAVRKGCRTSVRRPLVVEQSETFERGDGLVSCGGINAPARKPIRERVTGMISDAKRLDCDRERLGAAKLRPKPSCTRPIDSNSDIEARPRRGFHRHHTPGGAIQLDRDTPRPGIPHTRHDRHHGSHARLLAA